MGDFLVRKFVKDYENITNAQVRTRYGILSSMVGIVCNVLLFIIKLLIGIGMHSIAVMADAFNNLSDAASSVISFVGVKMASKPADKEHPFGHGRMEYIAAFIVAFLVIEVGLSLFKTSIRKLIEPEIIVFEWIPFVILLLSIGVKLWLSLFNKKYGKQIDSKVMLAAAADSMGDVITTSAAILSILISHFTDLYVDAAAGLLVSAVVMWSGVMIAKDTLEPLIGQAADPVLYRKVTEIVESHEGIKGTHDLVIHNYGPNKSMASIHAEVSKDVEIGVTHEMVDHIEQEVQEKLDLGLVIHMDPVDMKDADMLRAKLDVDRILQEMDADLSFHDLRMVEEDGKCKLIFDLVVPYEYGEEQLEKLKEEVRELIEIARPGQSCSIIIDRKLVNS